jgi:hypothetical protein
METLKELYVRKNSINYLEEVKNLMGCKSLKEFGLNENPCTDRIGEKQYRAYVIHALPQLQILDGIPISDQERALTTLRKSSLNTISP